MMVVNWIKKIVHNGCDVAGSSCLFEIFVA